MTEHLVPTLANLWLLLVRAGGDDGEFARILRSLGSDVTEAQVCRSQPPPSLQALDSAVSKIGSFDWLVVTSASGVHSVAARLQAQGLDPAACRPRNIAAVGQATNRALSSVGWIADIVPTRQNSRDLLSSMAIARQSCGVDSADSVRPSLLLPQSDIADLFLKSGLERLGYDVTPVVAYSTVVDEEQAKSAVAAIDAGEFDAVIFMSPSAARAVASARQDGLWPLVVAIGRRTDQECARLGIQPRVVAPEPTPEGIELALRDALNI